MNKSNTARSGMSLTSVLLVIFVVLKLTHNITWSWLWVLSPIWIGVAVILTFVALAGVGALILGGLEAVWNFFRR